MAYDRHLIAPLNSGLQKNLELDDYASATYNGIFSGRCIVSRKDRVDIKDITGEIFADLTVIRRECSKKYRGALWLCRCACGNETIAYGGHLRAGERVSCGCRADSRLEKTGIKNLYSLYKRKAIKRNKDFKLTVDEFKELVKGSCFYCNVEPRQVLKRQKTKKVQIVYNGIDRKDPERGYFIDNCVTSCMHCNRFKSNLTVKEFLAHIERVFKWHMIDT